MKTIEITKREKVETTDVTDLKVGIVAFQMVKFEINYFGNIIETEHDTKIMRDGKQIVMNGCGFIPAGYELN